MTKTFDPRHVPGSSQIAAMLRALAECAPYVDERAAIALVHTAARGIDDQARALGQPGSTDVHIREMGVADAARTVANLLDPPRVPLSDILFPRR